MKPSSSVGPWKLVFLASIVSLAVCHGQDWAEPGSKAYWNSGKAEITRYALTQSRYGELHRGDAVLIFVSEPFSRSKQVKLDHWETAGADAVNVLKLNFTKKFLTGIYPYSLMLSTFNPADGSPTLKVTMSGQEWCGQVYSQLNRRENGLELQNFSYFESEGDQHLTLPDALLEDNLWSIIRLAPEKLPTGKIELIPGTLIARLTHVPQKAEKAEGLLFPPAAENFGKFPADQIQGYRVTYQTGSDRVLEIYFEKAFPHQIVGWLETYTDFSGKKLTTTGLKTKMILLDYWKHHLDVDRPLRKELDLSTEN